jgi:2-C-methyl-D-erythritol 4-phosphate cytidylyltransferase / 2-C-methyl-D-erythritol 2,4-cyclodiphosphate synthase
MYVSAIIVAGGRGARLGAGRPKQLLEIGGRSMLQWCVTAFDDHPAVNEIVIVLPRDLSESLEIDAVNKDIELAIGGERRQDSVEAGFRATSPSADIVLVHDAARPFVSEDLISRVIAGAAKHGAVVPARRPSDTVKRASDAGAAVEETIPRETIWLAQTPQGFRRSLLAEAIAKTAGADVTDEATMVERAGHAVHIVEGDARNIKITTGDDLEQARDRAQPGKISREEFRVGTGYDLHRLVEGRPLVLAGVQIPCEKGPLGHSDGDVVCHAVCDAIFGAAGMGDIGRHFPDTDPHWKDVPGLEFAGRARDIIGEASWKVSSVDVTVILERPKLAPFMIGMRDALTQALGGAAVSIKAKTNEGVDATGRGEAIAAHAVAVITRPERAERVEG